MVFRTLLRLTGSREHLEDLAQEVFLRLYRALPNFRGEALVTTYLYRIAVNVAQDEWKRRRDAQSLVSISDEASGWEDRLQHPGRNAEELMEEREFAALVESQLQRLSGVERAVLVLYHQEERTYEQIAVALGLPIGTVRTHLHRGRKKLREGIEAARGSGDPAAGKEAAWKSGE
jgi:RNA polymerase sigma-70 factor (ECF subfamily)